VATFTSRDDLQGAEFVDADLHGARFCRADLSGVVMRAVHVQGADIDAPFLFRRETSFRVNGVDVVPLVEAELNRRFPGRGRGGATQTEGLCHDSGGRGRPPSRAWRRCRLARSMFR
jgi:hypothetical protein